jgi:hypothetical protein
VFLLVVFVIECRSFQGLKARKKKKGKGGKKRAKGGK